MIGNGIKNTTANNISSQENRTESCHRPKSFKEFIGQPRIISNIQTFSESAKKLQQPLDHTIIYGPPGLGKTTIAHIIATHMNANIRTISGPAITKKGDISAILSNLKNGDVLFIDEIHRMSIGIEEVMYSAMEDRKIDILIGEGPAAKTISIPIQPFTLVGATTQFGLLSKPLRTRFGINLELEKYSYEELSQIITQYIEKQNFNINKKESMLIAKRSRGTPRISLRISRRIIDFANVKNSQEITLAIIEDAFKQLKIHKYGLNITDLKYLKFIIDTNDNRPSGLNTISNAIEEDKQTIEDTIEPFLIQEGLIFKTAKGRQASQKCINLIQQIKH